MMGFWRYGGYGRGGWGGGYMFIGLLCLIVFIALIVWIIRMVTWRRHGMGCGMHRMYGMYGMHGMDDPRDLMENRQDEALDILRKRFAGGDITKEEYQERLTVLNGDKLHGMHNNRDMMSGKADESLDILRKRFASGEITKEEYDERLKVLNGEKQP
jgi:uncharacterized membrane protein